MFGEKFVDLKVSVIIPVYNVEKYLDKCVSSVVNQTYKNLEIILVNDGSPDKSPEMCDEWAKKDNRIIVIHKENGGLSDARNSGLDICTGDYITFVDSDDFLDEDACSNMLKNILQDNADLLQAQMACVSPIRTVYKANPKFEAFDNKLEFIPDYILNKNSIGAMACAKLYKKELFCDLRFLVGRIYEDAEIMHKILGKCNKVVIIPETVYFWRENIKGITHTKNLKYYSDMIFLYKEQVEFFFQKDKELSEKIYSKFYHYLIRTYFEVLVEKNNQVIELVLDELRKIFNNINSHNLKIDEIILLEDILNNVHRKELFKKTRKKINIIRIKNFIKRIIAIFVKNKDFYSIS